MQAALSPRLLSGQNPTILSGNVWLCKCAANCISNEGNGLANGPSVTSPCNDCLKVSVLTIDLVYKARGLVAKQVHTYFAHVPT
jgi:hypothetical protein